MTDLATKSDAGDASESVSDAPMQWAPAEPAPRKKRLWLWIGIPAAAVAVGAAAASLVLIAPGTTVAGVPVGLMTAGAATDAIDRHLAETTIALGDAGPTVTASDLGATIDAASFADAAFAARPLWNVTQWFGQPMDAEVTVDDEAATAALRTALPDDYTDPTAASVTYADGSFTVTPAVDGTGVDLSSVTAALHDGFVAGEKTVEVDPASTPVSSTATTENAQAAADTANAMLKKIGFYVGDERTVPVKAKTAASWLTIAADDQGQFSITADTAKIQSVVDTLKKRVDQDPVNGTVVTNSDGTVLSTSVPGADGRVLGDTGDIASDFAAQLASGNAVYELPVEVTPAKTTELQRLLEVDLSEQRLYLKQNGKVVDSWSISSGIAQSPTYQGHYRINSHITSQTMTASDPDDPYWNYEVENVQWVMYFNGDQAFHGVYWHNNFGTAMSHGCVGMPNYLAKQIYDWAPTGTDVWIHG